MFMLVKVRIGIQNEVLNQRGAQTMVSNKNIKRVYIWLGFKCAKKVVIVFPSLFASQIIVKSQVLFLIH